MTHHLYVFRSINRSVLSHSPLHHTRNHLRSRSCAFPTLWLRRNDAFHLSAMPFALSLNLFSPCSFSRNGCCDLVNWHTISPLRPWATRIQRFSLSCHCNDSSHCWRFSYEIALIRRSGWSISLFSRFFDNISVRSIQFNFYIQFINLIRDGDWQGGYTAVHHGWTGANEYSDVSGRWWLVEILLKIIQYLFSNKKYFFRNDILLAFAIFYLHFVREMGVSVVLEEYP